MTSPSLAATLAELRAKVGEPFGSLNDAVVKHLADSGIVSLALKPGDAMPTFALVNAEGALVRSQDLFERAPVVLSFYRGVWCPFCSAELEALHEAEPAIREAGGTLVAITAETLGLPLKVKNERGFRFEILCDLDNGLALACGLLHPISQELRQALVGAGIDFSLIYNNASWFLPLPATYIVGRDGTIKYAYVNPEFRERLDPGQIVTVLRGLSSTP